MPASERSGRAQRDCNRLIRVACRYTLDWIEGDKKALVEKFRYVKGTRASFPRASQRDAATCQADSHRCDGCSGGREKGLEAVRKLLKRAFKAREIECVIVVLS
eukprot:COSAG01_NODE_485_length_16397_cov_48.193827_12_plen_104_part_00